MLSKYQNPKLTELWNPLLSQSMQPQKWGWKRLKNIFRNYFSVWQYNLSIIVPCSQCRPENPRGHTHVYPFSSASWQTPPLVQGSCLAQAPLGLKAPEHCSMFAESTIVSVTLAKSNSRSLTKICQEGFNKIIMKILMQEVIFSIVRKTHF